MKELENKGTSMTGDETESKKMRNAVLIVLGVLLIIVGYRFLFVEPEGAFREVPDRLHGFWVTANQDHSNRYLELGADFITFGTGGVNSHRYKVTGFDEDRYADGRELDTIYYKDVDRSKYSRQFTLDRSNGKELIFTDQLEVVWVPE